MKSATLPRAEDKRIVRDALSSSNIFTAAVARLYVSFSTNEWKYAGLWGAVAFCKDRDRNNSYFIRLIDMEYGHGVVWEQELYEGFEYVKNCSFFHTFETDDYLAGLLFVHQGEADVFYDKVLNRESIKLKDNHLSAMKSVGQVTYVPGKGFSVDNNDPEVLQILHELEKLDDFSPEDIVKNQDFIQSFINQYRNNNKKATKSKRGPPPPPPPSRNRTKANPPPIPPMINRQNSFNRASPPPLPNRGIRQTPSMSSLNSSSPPRTPSPSNTAPLPPAPPPPPPPPPPLPIATTSPILATSSNDGRNSLMAAIRSTGGFGSLKKSGTLKNVSPTEKNGLQKSTNKPNGGNDMVSSLAAVLNQRKTAMQSDDENEEEDDDDDWK